MEGSRAIGRTGTDFAAVFAQSGEGMVLCTTDGTVCDANRAFCDLVRRSPEEVVGHSVFDFLDSRDRVGLAGRVERLLRGPMRTISRDIRLRTGRGHVLWAALTVSVISPPREGSRADEIPGLSSQHLLCLHMRDISEAKRLEEMLLDSDRRHRAIFAALSEGFLQVSGDGRVEEVNDAMCRMLGVGRAAIIGRPVTQFLSAEGCAALAAELERGALDRTFGLSFRHADGREVLTDVHPTGLGGPGGGEGGFVALIIDATERNLAERALAASEERYRTLVNSMQDGLVLVRGGRFAFVNAAAARIVGLTPEELVGRSFTELVDEADRSLVVDRYERRLRGEPVADEYSVRLRRADGRVAIVKLHTALVAGSDGDVQTIATIKDITEQVTIERDLRVLSSALDQSAVAVAIFDAQGAVSYVNERFCELTGWDSDEIVGRPASDLSVVDGEDDEDPVAEAIWHGRSWKGEARARRKNGEAFWEFVSVGPVRDDSGAITHHVAVKEDITPRKETEHRVWQQANFDAVTGLPNRVLFRDRLAQAITRARRSGEGLCLMFIDLDRFKVVNDTLGHEAGDELLVQVSDRLRGCVRESDTVARLAGDEFTVLLPEPGSRNDVSTVARRILEALRQRFVIADGREVFIGGSIGLALFPEDGEDSSTLLKNADTAMYRAKDDGRNTYQFYTAEMNADAMRRLELEGDLRRAVAEGELSVNFQPVYDSARRRIAGAEALVRWTHPTRGNVPPDDFLQVAEDIGLIGEVGDFVLRAACAEAAAWRASGHEDIVVSVNIADRQVTGGRLHHLVDEILADTGLPPGCLALEVGESLITRDTAAVDEVMAALAGRGVGLMIDDFGTGTASLRQLRRFPFKTLKLDRSFTRDMLQDPDDRVLVETVIAMARKLGLTLIAEGVETAEQMEWLRARKCDRFQGYLFGRPLPPEAFRTLLRRPVDDVGAALG